MNVIISAFWGEGPTDERFLPKLIHRALEMILFNCAKGEWEVYEPVVLTTSKLHFPEQVEDIVKKAKGYTLVFIHADADAKSPMIKAFPNKINPALQRLEKLTDQQACKNIIPVVPVTEMESWKLADFGALQKLLGVTLDARALGLDKKPKHLEQNAKVKELFQRVLIAATEKRGRRRNTIQAADIDEALAKMVGFDRLKQMDSFQMFLQDLNNMLVQLNIIEKGCDP